MRSRCRIIVKYLTNISRKKVPWSRSNMIERHASDFETTVIGRIISVTRDDEGVDRDCLSVRI